MLQNRVVVVTGAGGGIGAGTAEILAEKGAKLVLADFNRDALDAVTARLSAYPVITVDGDITDIDHIDQLVHTAVDKYGRIDGWVNNAGMINLSSAFDLSSDEARRELNVNVVATLECAKAAARQFIAQGGGGRIVNVASNAGKAGYPNMVMYNASKAAVISLTRTLAAEWAPDGINVNAVCPGGVNTPMLRRVAESIATRTHEDVEQLLSTMHPSQLGRHITTSEIGATIAFLLSDAAAIIRGQSINVDGGDTPY
ncbi:SDR family NAD(P)-dependent oxidoreductase (plasmid) [Streptomyces sp. AHU1]|uniref:SDR family NAD(P)-dependent oxidoreductase n=1 Tax=Streptomyces sp. AHU1 TaxID=3377215 RepID=UPI003877BF4B